VRVDNATFVMGIFSGWNWEVLIVNNTTIRCSTNCLKCVMMIYQQDGFADLTKQKQ
jgi:hypothetical protein